MLAFFTTLALVILAASFVVIPVKELRTGSLHVQVWIGPACTSITSVDVLALFKFTIRLTPLPFVIVWSSQRSKSAQTLVKGTAVCVRWFVNICQVLCRIQATGTNRSFQ
jgi:hypothetical protein